MNAILKSETIDPISGSDDVLSSFVLLRPMTPSVVLFCHLSFGHMPRHVSVVWFFFRLCLGLSTSRGSRRPTLVVQLSSSDSRRLPPVVRLSSSNSRRLVLVVELSSSNSRRPTPVVQLSSTNTRRSTLVVQLPSSVYPLAIVVLTLFHYTASSFRSIYL